MTKKDYIIISSEVQNALDNNLPIVALESTIISHGINSRFSGAEREFKSINNYNNENRFKILYVSKIDVHKHQIAYQIHSYSRSIVYNWGLFLQKT